jgi:hypothetical protein
VRGLYVAAGFNSIGIQSAGGAGKVLADRIVHGHPPMDLWDVDIRRCMPFQRNRRYLRNRVSESLGLLYAMHWPFRQPGTARCAQVASPTWASVQGVYDEIVAAGQGFGLAHAGYHAMNALLRQKEVGVRRRLVSFMLDTPEPLIYHAEPVWRDGVRVGRITSGMFAHTFSV